MPRNNTPYNWGYRQGRKAFAAGGEVSEERAEKKADAAQDKAMMARHNKLMHPGQKSKMNCGGKVTKGK